MNKKTKDIIEYVVIIVIVLLFRRFLFSPIRVTGASMLPTLNDGDIMILNKIGYSIKGLNRFDIVVVKSDNEKIIKRVIGLPSEHVEYKDDKLYINGEEVDEPYDRKETEDFVLEMLGENKIPEGKYLVLGDNRPISKDSRIIGLIDKKDIVGYTSIVIYPFNRIKNAK